MYWNATLTRSSTNFIAPMLRRQLAYANQRGQWGIKLSMITGHTRDEDLLLMSHHALPFWRHILIRIHLCICTSCRLRQERLAQISRLLAGAIREPSDMAWQSSISLTFKTLPLLLTSAVLLLALCFTLFWNHLHVQPPPGNHALSAPCRPDLPNDRCR